jgi:cytochrome c oxidase subunit 2
VAQSAAEFEAWRTHQLQPATQPTDPLRAHGEQVFMNNRCGSCHGISGTEAFGTVGPDLTHVATRSRLAMGTIGNDSTGLAHWIRDPQSIKPGVQMPNTPLGSEDQSALVAYLEGLR